MAGKIKSKTGSAPIVKQGHTTDGRYGSDPNAQRTGGRNVRELKR